MPISPVDIAYYVSLGKGLEKGGGPGTGYLLTDPEYIQSRGILKSAGRAADRAAKAAVATERGAKEKQGRFLTAAGFGEGFKGRAAKALDPVLQAYATRGRGMEKQAFESDTARALAERDQERSDIYGALSTASGVEAGIASAVLASNPITASFAPLATGLGAARSAFYGAAPVAIPGIRRAEAERQGTYVDPSVLINRYLGGLGEPDEIGSAYAGRGGGGRDFYRAYQG